MVKLILRQTGPDFERQIDEAVKSIVAAGYKAIVEGRDYSRPVIFIDGKGVIHYAKRKAKADRAPGYPPRSG